ncbi:MAG: hypothetical protein ACLR6J_16505 [Parabacteroides merdae]
MFQCLAGEWENPVEKILLTASGRSFPYSRQWRNWQL